MYTQRMSKQLKSYMTIHERRSEIFRSKYANRGRSILKREPLNKLSYWRWLFLFLGALSVGLLSSCVSLQAPKVSSSPFRYVPAAVRAKQLSQLQRWQLSGAFSIVETGHSAELANYAWFQRGQSDYRIRVFSPLNLYSVTILGQKKKGVMLQKANGQTLLASTPEALLQQALGWSLPIRNLYYWVRGITAAGAVDSHYDRYGHLIRFREQGWIIQLSHYSQTKTGVDLPGKLIMQRPGVQVTMVMKRWMVS